MQKLGKLFLFSAVAFILAMTAYEFAKGASEVADTVSAIRASKK